VANYTFTLLAPRPSPYGGCYRLAVVPRRQDKFLYRGEICVNAVDFAVESIDAEPQKIIFLDQKDADRTPLPEDRTVLASGSNQTVTNMLFGAQPL